MDLYYSVPCFLTNESYQKIKSEIKDDENSKGAKILKKIEQVMKKEVVNSFNDSLDRMVLYDNIEMLAFENGKEIAKVSFFVILTVQKNTLLGRVLIGTNEIDMLSSVNFIDDITNENIYIKIDNKLYSFEQWFDLLNIKLVGTTATAVFSKENLLDDYKSKVLAADKNSELAKDVFSANFKNNLSFVVDEKIIASEVAIIQQNKKISDDIEANIDIYGTTLFVLELLCLKDASVSKTDYLVKKQLEDSKGISFTIKELEKMIYESALAMDLWDIRIFRFHVTEMFSKRLDEVFVIDELLRASTENRRKLQQFVDVRSAIITEEENKAINFLLLFLALFQVIPIIYSITNYFMFNELEINDLIASIYTFSFCLLIILIFNIRVSRNKKKIK